jgi:hypothetical protein
LPIVPVLKSFTGMILSRYQKSNNSLNSYLTGLAAV